MLSHGRRPGTLSRKGLLRAIGLGGAGALLAACAPATPPTPTAAPKPPDKPAEKPAGAATTAPAAATTAPAAAATTAPAAAATTAPAAAATTAPAAATTAPAAAAKPAAAEPTKPAAAATTAPAAAKPAAAGGKQFKLRMGVLPAEANPEWASYVRFKEIVEKDTGGNVQVTLIGNSQLGTERELTEQVKLGALEMTTGGGDIQGFAPEVGLFYLPFLYPTDEGFVKVWDLKTSPIAQQVAKIVLEKTSTIRALSFLPAAGTRNLILKGKPIKTIEDFKGVKIRVDTAPTSFKTMQALGAAPVPIAFPEVYNALQTGVVDAAENILSTFRVQKWAEVAKFVSLTEHNRTIQPFLAHGRRLEKHLAELGVPHDFKLYPGVGHAFMNDHGGGLMAALGRRTKMRAAHDPVAAEDAWGRMLGFFAEHL